jgi:proteasome lid subunit RPN8/RPN11
MKNHANSEHPKECCGIITTDFEYVPYKNIAPDPENYFILDPIAFVDYPDNCWAIFHSHPDQDNPLPSENDIESTSFEEYKFIVGWKEKFYLYWYDTNIESLKFKKFTEDYLRAECNS